jgi:hypothetical protein
MLLQPTAVSLFELFNDLLAIYSSTVVYMLRLFANLDVLEGLLLLTKRLCWRCCFQRNSASRKRLYSGFGVSTVYWYIRVQSRGCWRGGNRYKRSCVGSRWDVAMSCDKVGRRRCSNMLLRTLFSSMNLYSTRRQDGNIVPIGQLDKISAILLIFSKAVYRVSVLL